ncbi:UbiA family prenyltransferase [Dongia sp.]|uniref:UbiA family prenyltransferase n=1 Tax=Dongia sp. TaxID=1977262 RepID=UPI0035B3A4C7
MGPDNFESEPVGTHSLNSSPGGVTPADRPILIAACGTIFPTDIAHERLIEGALHQTAALWRAFVTASGRRRSLTDAMAEEIALAPQGLPVAAELVEWLKAQHAAGRPLFLLPDSAAGLAHQGPLAGIAGLLSPDDALPASIDTRWRGGFTFVGDRRQHPAIASAAAAHVTVSARADGGMQGARIEADFSRAAASLSDWLRAVRPHHWAKNLMIFIPFLLDRGWTDADDLVRMPLGFAVLILVVSATYLFNDLSDVGADRRHWSKHRRPIARGAIPIAHAAAATAGGLAIGLFLGWLLSPAFAGFLLLYVALTVLYSVYLKTIPLLDALVIAMLFTSRLTMGIALTGDRFSEWLLTFAMFFFFDLALAKRHAELLRSQEHANALSRRGYVAEDAALTLVVGVGSGIAALVIMIVFLVLDAFQRNTFLHPNWLWAIPLLLAIWLGRIWILAHRGAMPDDPITFALRDRSSLSLGVFVAVSFLLAL